MRRSTITFSRNTKHIIHIGLVIILVALFCCCNSVQERKPEISNSNTEISDEYLIMRWKQFTVSIEEIDELSNSTYKDWEEWNKFVSRIHEMKDNIEIWTYCSPANTWENLMGSQGYAIFKENILIDYIETLVN